MAQGGELAGAGRGEKKTRDEFERAMRRIYERAKTEAGYNATYYLSMLAEHGGLGTAKRLLAATKPSQGFTALYERGRLDLTVEALVVQSPYADLFTEEEQAIAQDRLDRLGFRG